MSAADFFSQSCQVARGTCRLDVLNVLLWKLLASVYGTRKACRTSLPAMRFANERSNYTVLKQIVSWHLCLLSSRIKSKLMDGKEVPTLLLRRSVLSCRAQSLQHCGLPRVTARQIGVEEACRQSAHTIRWQLLAC